MPNVCVETVSFRIKIFHQCYRYGKSFFGFSFAQFRRSLSLYRPRSRIHSNVLAPPVMLTPDTHIGVRFVLQRKKIRAHIHAFNANRKTFNASHRVAISKKMKALYWRGHKGKHSVIRFHYIVLKYTILIVIAFGSYRIAPSVHMDVREPRQRHHEEWRRTTEIQKW